jgi:hypothetical protein
MIALASSRDIDGKSPGGVAAELPAAVMNARTRLANASAFLLSADPPLVPRHSDHLSLDPKTFTTA